MWAKGSYVTQVTRFRRMHLLHDVQVGELTKTTTRLIIVEFRFYRLITYCIGGKSPSLRSNVMSENRIPKPGFILMSIGHNPTVALVDGVTRYPYRISRRDIEDPRSPRFISLPNYLTTAPVVDENGKPSGIGVSHGKQLVGVVYTDKYGNQSIVPEPKVKFLLGEPLGNGTPLTL